MEYEYRVCCFVDVLGFSHHLEDTIDEEGNDNSDKIDDILRAIDMISRIPTKGDKYYGESRQITQFSDSIVISFKVDDEDQVFFTLMEFMFISLELANVGYLTRGGITWGKLYHTDEIIFGPAMVEAYKLESKKAFFPRIIVNKDLFKIGEHFSDKTESEMKDALDGILTLDDDNEYYIDYISKSYTEFNDPKYDTILYVEQLRKIITKGMKTSNPTVISKMYWLKNKFNSFVDELVKTANDNEHYDGDYDIVKEYRNLTKIE